MAYKERSYKETELDSVENEGRVKGNLIILGGRKLTTYWRTNY